MRISGAMRMGGAKFVRRESREWDQMDAAAVREAFIENRAWFLPLLGRRLCGVVMTDPVRKGRHADHAG